MNNNSKMFNNLNSDILYEALLCPINNEFLINNLIFNYICKNYFTLLKTLEQVDSNFRYNSFF